jgi:outer membrane protein OmpA-like peptidoglycan-associated protein
MSDAQPPESVESPAETPATTAPATGMRQPWLIPAFIIIVLLVVLVMLNLGQGGGKVGGSEDLAGLKAEANALREQLNRERVALGLRPLEGNVESMQDVATRLSKDAETMVALAGSFQNMLVEKDAEISAKNSELIRSEQLRQSLANESNRLQAELQRALVDASEVDLLRRESAQLKQQRDVLAEELAGLRQQLALNAGAVSAEIHADLERRLEETTRARDFFEARVAELEAELAQSKLFASNENELLPAAVELFRSLRGLEGKPDSEISSAYSSLGVELGASVLHTLKFKTGSSALSPEDQETIRRMVDEIPDGDLLLAIGYASETGNVDANRELSSDRATAAASHFVSLKRPGQLAQAVYLGQTDRFSSRIPERNQIVELWRVRRKQP